jgi:hypothetical protein
MVFRVLFPKKLLVMLLINQPNPVQLNENFDGCQFPQNSGERTAGSLGWETSSHSIQDYPIQDYLVLEDLLLGNLLLGNLLLGNLLLGNLAIAPFA